MGEGGVSRSTWLVAAVGQSIVEEIRLDSWISDYSLIASNRKL